MNRCFQQTLAVYTGHPKIGYASVSDSVVTRVHPGSSLMHTEGAMPKYIVYNQVRGSNLGTDTTVSQWINIKGRVQK